MRKRGGLKLRNMIDGQLSRVWSGLDRIVGMKRQWV